MQVSLKKNGWHRKIQEFVFDYPPRYESLCPYFWFTVFCLIASPFVAIYQLFALIPKSFYSLMDFLDSKVCQPMYKKELENLTEDQLYKYFYDINVNGNNYYGRALKSYKKWDDYKTFWLSKNKYDYKGFEKKIEKKMQTRWAIEKVQREKLEKEMRLRAQKRVEKNKKFFSMIVRLTSWIVPMLLGMLSLAALTGIFYLIYKLYLMWNKEYTLNLFLVLKVIIAAGLGLYVFVLVLKLISKCNLEVFKFKKSKNTKPSKLREFFVSVKSFFYFYFKSVKENYCPMIEWEEKE